MKNIIFTAILGFAILTTFSTCKAEESGTIVQINTNKGKIQLLLFDDTPQHRDNFIKLTEEHKYDSIFFHRVINLFMIQAGNTNAKAVKENKSSLLGLKKKKKEEVTEEKPIEEENLGYTIPAEIVFPKYFHKRGMLGAARTGDDVNPLRASSASQFYIVTGKFYTEAELNKLEKSSGITFTPEQRTAYMIEGGAPHLDSKYTVFGKVIKGMKVAEKIQAVPTSSTDRPLEQVVIKSVKILKK